MRLFRLSLDRGPSDAFGRVALGLGLASLVPVVGPAMAVLAVLTGTVGTILSSRNPERWGGRRNILVGLSACALGLALFFAEGAVFLKWKVRQAYDQRVEVSRLRLAEIGQALERYREAHGSYPQVSGIMALGTLLAPRYLPECPRLDGFDQAISVDSRPTGFTLTCAPPPRGKGGTPPPPLEVHGTFQPAPAPQVLPPDFVGPPAPPGLSSALPAERQPDAGTSGSPPVPEAGAQATPREAPELPRAGESP